MSSAVAPRGARAGRAIARAVSETSHRASASASDAARAVGTHQRARAIAAGSSASTMGRASAFARGHATRGRGVDAWCALWNDVGGARTFASTSGSDGEGEDGEDGAREDGGEDAERDDSSTESAVETEGGDKGWVFGVKNQRRPTRRDKGSYDGFLTEIDSYPTRNDIRDLYNMREWVEASLEESYAEVEALADKLIKTMEQGEKLREKYGDVVPGGNFEIEEDPDAVLTWTSEFVMEPGDVQEHPLNWKVSVEVKLSELQRVTGLSDEAIEYVKLLVDKRYNPKQDVLRIVCRRNENREHNRQWCLKVLYDLIQEANREYPSESYQFTGKFVEGADAKGSAASGA